MISREGPIDVKPHCTHQRVGGLRFWRWRRGAEPVVTYRVTENGNVEMTKEIVCRECGAHIWFLTSHGATRQLIVPMTWDGNVAMAATHAARSQPNGATLPAAPQKRRPTDEEVIAGIRKKMGEGKENGEGPGTELAILSWQKDLVMSCSACDDLARQMNAWGLDECRRRLEDIVDDMLPRAKKWVAENRQAALKRFIDESRCPQSIKDWLQGKREALDDAARAARALVDVETPMIRAKVTDHVNEALDNWESRQATLKGD